MSKDILLDEKVLLQFDPFESEYDGEITTIRDKVVIARKSGNCFSCHEIIDSGEQIRSITTAFDGMIRTDRFCATCCQAMIDDENCDYEHGEKYEERLKIGRDKRMRIES